MPQIAGGCLCGKVRYSGDTEPAFTAVCHCRDCQKESGSAFAVVVGVPESSLSVQGEPKTYTVRSDAGRSISRLFCPECGSTIFDKLEARPGMMLIEAGTLDDPSWVKPGVQIYTDSAQPWVHLGGELQSFAKMPG